jgi:hypothetical protein
VVKHAGSKTAAFTAMILLLMTLSGCLYPKDQTPGRDVTVRGVVRTLQDAVKRYQEDTGLLPILNADASVPPYEKYKVDFAKLKRMGYVGSLPEISFENGGGYVFLILDEETNPKVKLLDVAVHQGIAAIQRKVEVYRQEKGGRLPAGDQAYPGFKYLDFTKLGTSRPDLRSMYSGNPLEWIVDESGKVYGDYGIDIAEAVRQTGKTPKADEDVRHSLVEASDFVPVYAPVYKWVNGAPQAQTSSAS